MKEWVQVAFFGDHTSNMERTAAAGALGPRLAGRLTAELVLRSAQYMNCVSEFEIDLRGKKWYNLLVFWLWLCLFCRPVVAVHS